MAIVCTVVTSMLTMHIMPAMLAMTAISDVVSLQVRLIL